jgi:6-phosphogluconolactonase
MGITGEIRNMRGYRRQIEVVPTAADAAAVAQQLIAAAANVSIGKRGFFRVALSGGSTPRPVYEALAGGENLNWPRWQIFWSDERTVPPTSPESNYRLVKETLLDGLARRGEAPRMVVRMAGEGDPDAAAADYERAVRETVPANPKSGAGETPRFDLLLLGIGGDGHTASLFPHTQALGETERLVAANLVPQLNTTRLTFTFPLINAARRVLVLVTGESKAAILREVLQGDPDPQRLPSQSIRPVDGTLTWLVDEAAHAQMGR